jgi:hypothetical protein
MCSRVVDVVSAMAIVVLFLPFLETAAILRKTFSVDYFDLGCCFLNNNQAF